MPEQELETIGSASVLSAKSMEYERAVLVINNSAVNPQVAEQLQLKLRRIVISIGALLGKALGVHDFHFCFYPDDARRRQLHVWYKDQVQGEGSPTASLRLVLNAEHQIDHCDDLVIMHSSAFKARCARSEKG